MKKLVFVNASLTGGGSERVMTHIANYCCNVGFDVYMILVRKKEKTYKTNKQIKLIQLDNDCSKFKLFFKRIIEIRKYVKASNADTVISFMDDISFFVAMACIGLNKRLVFSIRNDPKRKDKKLHWILGRYFNLPMADVIVFQTFQAKYCYPKSINKKGVVIPNPIDADILPPIEKYCPDNRIVAVGRLVPQKAFDLLIDAFSVIYQEYRDLKLEIYGEGECYRELKTQIEEKNLSECVELKGYSNNVLQNIKGAKMYISVSDFEGISNTMLEAMAIGLPTISTDCPIGGAAMVINDNENGLLIPVRNRDALVAAITIILENEKLAFKFSENAVRVRNDYSLSVIGNQWIKIL